MSAPSKTPQPYTPPEAAPGNYYKTEILSLLAQSGVFLLGLVLSLILGILLATRTDGPAGLLLATVAAGAGLLAAAGLSQRLRDWMLERNTR